MFASHAVDVYRAGDAQISFRGRLDKSSRARAIVFSAGRTYPATEPQLVPSLYRLIEFLVEHGYGVFSIDAGGTTTWCNDLSITATGEAISWVRGASGWATSEKVVLFGHSMGGGEVINYASRNPSNVAGIIAASPLSDLDFWHSDSTYTAQIDTAYGGTYAAQADAHNPIKLAPSLVTPVRLYEAADDTTNPPSQVHALASALPASSSTMIDLTSGGHTDFFDGVDRFGLLQWLSALSW